MTQQIAARSSSVWRLQRASPATRAECIELSGVSSLEQGAMRGHCNYDHIKCRAEYLRRPAVLASTSRT